MKLQFSRFFNRITLKSATALSVIVAVSAPYAASACTSFVIPTTDGSGIYARTMEFGVELESNALVIPRGYTLKTEAADGKEGMSWKAKYAAVGMNALGVTTLVDGMNEKGLAGGVLYFPEFAGYADASKSDVNKSLAPWDVLSWILTNYATVDEVKEAIQDMSVVGIKQQEMGFIPPLHYTINDANGDSIVIEPINGKLRIHDNPLGVMTNSPSFEWHLTNIRNYLKISALNAKPLTIDEVIFPPLGQGSGLLGLPGDSTPPSRFIRAAAYVKAVKKQPSGLEAVRTTEHILNNFDIPKGWIQNDDSLHIPLEFTQWSTIADMKNRKYYVKMYDDQVLRGIDINDFDLNAKDLKTATMSPHLTPAAVEFKK